MSTRPFLFTEGLCQLGQEHHNIDDLNGSIDFHIPIELAMTDF